MQGLEKKSTNHFLNVNVKNNHIPGVCPLNQKLK